MAYFARYYRIETDLVGLIRANDSCPTNAICLACGLHAYHVPNVAELRGEKRAEKGGEKGNILADEKKCFAEAYSWISGSWCIAQARFRRECSCWHTYYCRASQGSQENPLHPPQI